MIPFFGLVTDVDFASSDSIQIEVVETGSSVSARFNEQFNLQLPQDTLWNICIKEFPANNSNSDNSLNSENSVLEKCYELKYLGGDSTFYAEISGEETVTWFEDGSNQIENGNAGIENGEKSGESLNPENRGSDDEQITELRKVVVQLRKKPKRKLGESVVSAKNIKRMPGLAEADVMRSIQALPGVVASSDFSTKIYVRGGASDQNLFLLDNGIVYSPTHFFGLFSTFLVEAVDEVKFYKSGFPAEYGNRLSSVAAINSRKGGNDTLSEWFSNNSIKVSTFAAQAHTEGHKGDARWVLAVRSTYIKQILDALKAAGATDFSVDYKFTDIQGAFDYALNDDMDLHFAIYTGADILNFSPLFVDWGNTVTPVNFNWRINDEWTLNSNVAFTEFHQDFTVEDLLSMKNSVMTIAGRQSVSYSGIEEHTISLGYDLEFSKVSFIQDIQMSGQKIEDNPQAFHHILYVQDAWRPKSWDLQYGVRFNYHSLSEHFGAEPRFAAAWEFAENQKLEFHTGYYLQYLNSLMFSDQESLNEFYYPSRKTAINGTVLPSSSILTAFGYSRSNILGMFNFNAEAYYKTQNNLTVYDESDLTPEESAKIESLGDVVKSGEGYSFGYELSLQKPEGFVSGSINWNQGISVFKDGPGESYYPNWHQPFALKSDLSFNWFEKNYYLRTSFQLKWASGMPYTPYIGYLSYTEPDMDFPGYGLISPMGNRNTTLQTSYFRLDAKVIDWGKKDKWNFSFTILNLTDHDNLFFTFWDTEDNPPTAEKIYQFPFFPLLMSWEYYF